MSGLTGSPLLRPTELLASLTETFTSALSTVRSPSPLADITTVATGRFHRRVFHPLDLQLASLHWLPSFHHVLGDARLRDLKAELEQFAVDARRAPKWIVDADPPDQHA